MESTRELFLPGGDAAQDYERLLGHRVIIYYQDQRGTDRKLVGILSRLGIEFSVPVAESEGISGLDSQKASGKAIYGKGYIVSDRVKAEREKAEREKAEREKAERWTLSDRELAIIHRLNQQHHENE